MKWPQVVMIAMYVLNIYDTAQHHGEPRRGTNNVLVALLGVALSVVVLYYGGFWR